MDLRRPALLQSLAKDHSGDVSPEQGFVEGLVILGGRTIRGVGGGVCQVSTTAFQAAFYAGYPILERYPHGYRVMTNLTNHSRRERLLYGCPLELTDSEAIQWWKDQVLHVEPIPPVTVNDGPVKQHVQVDDEVDLREIPWVRTRQDARVKLMVANELGFPTMGGSVLKAEIPVGHWRPIATITPKPPRISA